MFFRHVSSGVIVEVMDIDALPDPFKGRFHAGEEMPDSAEFRKFGRSFLCGERLPRCGWTRITRSAKSEIKVSLAEMQSYLV